MKEWLIWQEDIMAYKIKQTKPKFKEIIIKAYPKNIRGMIVKKYNKDLFLVSTTYDNKIVQVKLRKSQFKYS